MMLKPLVLASLLTALSACATQYGEVTVRNLTPETLDVVSIEVSGNDLVVRNLAAGASQTFTYRIRHEDGYTIHLKTATGRTEDAEVGYVAAGLPARSRIDVTPSGIIETLLDEDASGASAASPRAAQQGGGPPERLQTETEIAQRGI